MGRKPHVSDRRLSVWLIRLKGIPILDVLSSLGSQTFGWMGMYVQNLPPSSVVFQYFFLLQGIWGPNDEHADGDHVAQ